MIIPKQLAVGGAHPGSLLLHPIRSDLLRRARATGAFLAGRLRSVWSRRVVRLVVLPMALLSVLAAGPVHHVYFDRSNLPDLEAFLRFEPPRIGEIYDDQGKVLIELARQYRRVVSFEEVPPILREAILAAEDKNFFSHSGVEYSAIPRVVRTTVQNSLSAWWKGDGFRPHFPQGGSTLTQQLVRGYFLPEMTLRENGV